MTHLYLNGVGVECQSSEFDLVTLGSVTRSLNGAPRSTHRVKKRSLRCTTDMAGLLASEAEALRALIHGEGHSWNFETEDLFSSKGLLPSSVTGDVVSGVEPGKYGDFRLYILAPGSVEWQLGIEPAAWTISLWRLFAPDWYHYVLRRTSLATPIEVWENGIQTNTDPVAGEVSITLGGSLLIDNTLTNDTNIDDLVVLPYAVPDSWPPQFYAWQQQNTWPPLPYVHASGAALPGDGLRTLGEVGTTTRVPKRDSGGAFVSGEVFNFTLHGV